MLSLLLYCSVIDKGFGKICEKKERKKKKKPHLLPCPTNDDTLYSYLINLLYLVIALFPPASMTRRSRYRKKAMIRFMMIAFIENGAVG